MDMGVCSLWDYYYERAIRNLLGVTLTDQLKALSSCNILIIDCCGSVYKYIDVFRQSNSTIMVLENDWEKELVSLKEERCKYDMVYAIATEQQMLLIDFPAIKIVVDMGSILKIYY